MGKFWYKLFWLLQRNNFPCGNMLCGFTVLCTIQSKKFGNTSCQRTCSRTVLALQHMYHHSDTAQGGRNSGILQVAELDTCSLHHLTPDKGYKSTSPPHIGVHWTRVGNYKPASSVQVCMFLQWQQYADKVSDMWQLHYCSKEHHTPCALHNFKCSGKYLYIMCLAFCTIKREITTFWVMN